MDKSDILTIPLDFSLNFTLYNDKWSYDLDQWSHDLDHWSFDQIAYQIRIQRGRLPLYTYFERIYHVFGRRRLNS